ncbi:hypothetical protein FK535_04360 [Mycolicibacterium sp. 018/SC-01/001]|uniref:hypothetical protein n=1 Tax=Mycolicibacterium sp. 018/SC-01/001 TaxID=2592069 RepID=UPI00117C8B6D|nr:hypothetical protein [Mycolicibacterium sp. 018/SC-01/001]TRW88431.1 hypothetical protein FK535_04360 [Mycolicibacterium sp. 018/SC-01/001]
MIRNILLAAFRISVAAFLLGGAAVVGLQIVGLALGNGAFVDSITDNVAPWAYGAAGVAGLLAFALSYFRVRDSGDAESAPTPVHEHA